MSTHSPETPPGESPKPGTVLRVALCGLAAAAFCPEPVTGFVVGAALAAGKTLFDRCRAGCPSRRARAALAKSRYWTSLRVLARSGLRGFELSAARDAARQQYLRELAEALK